MLKLVDFDIVYLEKSFIWLNDEEINKLISAGHISQEKQFAWFASLKNRQDYKAWGVEYDGIPIGVCGIKHMEGSQGEYFGYIGEKQYWGRGLGTLMMFALEQQARYLRIQRLELRVLKENMRAIRLYHHLHYSMISEDEHYWYMAKVI